MKSNALTIIKKEFSRFFGDRQLLFTTVIMPGLLIYLIYSLMGVGIQKMETEGADDMVTLRVENLPESVAPMLEDIHSIITLQQPVSQEDIDQLESKDLNEVLVRFPEAFDELIATYSPESGEEAPNVEIYYNSANNASSRVYYVLEGSLSAYEDQLSNRFDINRRSVDSETGEVSQFDMASQDDKLGSILSKLIPMLILMMLFSGVMAIAPTAIAGEKERGTIATLLVTPMRRNELALGKVVSLSGIALLSGISSFIGIALSLPKMIPNGADLGFNYTGADYTVLLVIILATVLIMASAVSLLSALAKDVKNAGTMIAPFMMVIMFCGLIPMFQNGASENLAVYLIPFYNSVQVMTATFAHEMTWTPVIITLAANVLYTGVAVWGLTKMFNSEKVMFSR